MPKTTETSAACNDSIIYTAMTARFGLVWETMRDTNARLTARINELETELGKTTDRSRENLSWRAGISLTIASMEEQIAQARSRIESAETRCHEHGLNEERHND